VVVQGRRLIYRPDSVGEASMSGDSDMPIVDSERGARPQRPGPTCYASVVRRASFWNCAGTHHLRKYRRQPRQ
jgi:hypothetical protein